MPPSPIDISHLTHSNAVPTTSETKQIREGIQTLEHKAADLRAQLQELESQLQQHRGILSPIRLLPLEVLGHIFSLVLPDILDEVDRTYLIGLSLVCRSWCEAARATLKLWRGVELKRYDINFDRIMAWYGHSGSSDDTLPKSLKWVVTGWHDCQGRNNSHIPQCESANPTLARLLFEGPVLDHLTIKVPSKECYRRIMDSIHPVEPHLLLEPGQPSPSRWASLRSLTLGFGNEWTENTRSTHPPHLTEFRLHLPLHKDAFARVVIHPAFLNNLTTFELSCDWTHRHILELLQHCINVKELVLNMGSYAGYRLLGISASFQNLSFPRLRTLRFRHLRRAWSMEMFGLVRAPHLRHLDISFMDMADPSNKHTLDLGMLIHINWVSLMKKWGDLRTLRIHNVHIASDALHPFLVNQLPALTRLTLDSVMFDPLLFSFLGSMSFPFGGKYFPVLETLEILNLPAGFDLTPLFDFLRDRRPWHKARNNNETVFEAPPDKIARLVLTYREQEKVSILDPYADVLGVLKDAGIYVQADTRYEMVDVM
ncbi:hypothetical protein DFP72DRAFT_932786 [Ephemerocybe angulata]|uniref:F-box domain-containing protein n=1 Tax=Ephemerocybe angulata TaxID=980116 RepID=A0A8H6HCU5_9AGAR|nr:hypothetical protein DFP72DRAFT_932786 [Tulosesus angulatus]